MKRFIPVIVSFICVASLLANQTLAQGEQLNLQVNASADDAHQKSDNTVSTTSSSVRINGSLAWGGFRFTGITIPQGATINSAVFRYYIEDTAHDDVNHVIYAEASDNASQFADVLNNISDRTRTGTSVYEVQNGAGAGWRSAPDISALIQEVIDRPGWNSGNALAIIIDGSYSASPYLYTESWDGNPALAAQLEIVYSAGTPTDTPTATNTPTATPTGTLTPTATPTITPTPGSVVITNTLNSGNIWVWRREVTYGQTAVTVVVIVLIGIRIMSELWR